MVEGVLHRGTFVLYRGTAMATGATTFDGTLLRRGEEGARAARLPRRRAARGAGEARPVLPRRPLPGRRPRGLSAAGGLRLERAPPRAGLYERRGDRRRDRRRRARACGRDRERRPA